MIGLGLALAQWAAGMIAAMVVIAGIVGGSIVGLVWLFAWGLS